MVHGIFLNRKRNALVEGIRYRKHEPTARPPIYLEKDKDKPKKKYKPLPTIVGFIIPIIGTVIIICCGLLQTLYPKQVPIADEALYPDSFIGERAENYSKGLVAIGPRIVGSVENEVSAVQYLSNIITNIKKKVDTNVHNIELDIQKPTGTYYLKFKPYGHQNSYHNITNVVAKLSPVGGAQHSVLVNCHFDTVPNSPGASDNSLNCAVLLEILTKLSMSKKPFRHNIIFLFNGAEENPLQGSHAFVSQHKWSKECKVVVNVDSGGAGGKEMLFQTTSAFPWLIQLYAKVVPHPNAAVIAEEVFQANLIPSDTDFRIWREFGPIPGFDFAHSNNGYIYHTRLDTLDFIKPGVYQSTGDNMLALVKALADSHEIDLMDVKSPQSKESIIFYDFLGLFMVVYSENIGYYIAAASVVFSLYSIVAIFKVLPTASRDPWTHFLSACAVQLLNWLLTGAYIFLLALVLDAAGATMGWYSATMNISTMYGTPLLFGGGVLPVILHKYYKHNMSRDEKVIVHCTAVQFLFTLLLIVLTSLGLRSSFVIMLFVFLPAAVNSILLAIKLFNVPVGIFTFSIIPLIPTIYAMYTLVQAIRFFAPVSGRSGVGSNPEIMIAGFVFLLGILTSAYATPMLLLFKSPLKISGTLLALSVVVSGLTMFTPFGSPYSENVNKPALQRFNLMQTERKFFDETGKLLKFDSGYSLIGMDRNDLKYLKRAIREVKNAVPVKDVCNKMVYCGVPVYLVRMGKDAPHSYWIPANISKLEESEMADAQISDISANPNGKTRTFELKVKGPDHITVLLQPRHGVSLSGWSYSEGVPPPGIKFDGRPVNLIYFSTGWGEGNFNFTIDLTNDGSNMPLADVAIVGHFMHGQSKWSDEFKNFVTKFPGWTNVQPWATSYISRVIA